MADQETRGAAQTFTLEGEDIELVYRALVAYNESEAKSQSQTRLATARRAHQREQLASHRLQARIRIELADPGASIELVSSPRPEGT